MGELAHEKIDRFQDVEQAFQALIEPYRRELLVHCYRMLGSLDDAEDLVQETFLRAWRSLATFVRPLYFRAWLYKIATNACLNELASRSRRSLPNTLHPPSPADQSRCARDGPHSTPGTPRRPGATD